MFIKLVKSSLNTPKDAFAHLGGKLGDPPNKRRETVDREIIQHLKSGTE